MNVVFILTTTGYVASVFVGAQLPDDATVPAQGKSAPVGTFSIVAFDQKVVERNSSWHKHAWLLTMRNSTPEPVSFTATVHFLDADGFLLDDDTAYFTIPAETEQDYRGYALLEPAIAAQVASSQVRVER